MGIEKITEERAHEEGGLAAGESHLQEIKDMHDSPEYCELRLKEFLWLSGYSRTGTCSSEDMQLEKIGGSCGNYDGGIVSEGVKKCGCVGERWQRFDDVIYICDCGLNFPLVTTNVPNSDYGYSELKFDSEGFVCALRQNSLMPISFSGLIKMYARREL